MLTLRALVVLCCAVFASAAPDPAERVEVRVGVVVEGETRSSFTRETRSRRFKEALAFALSAALAGAPIDGAEVSEVADDDGVGGGGGGGGAARLGAQQQLRARDVRIAAVHAEGGSHCRAGCRVRADVAVATRSAATAAAVVAAARTSAFEKRLVAELDQRRWHFFAAAKSVGVTATVGGDAGAAAGAGVGGGSWAQVGLWLLLPLALVLLARHGCRWLARELKSGRHFHWCSPRGCCWPCVSACAAGAGGGPGSGAARVRPFEEGEEDDGGDGGRWRDRDEFSGCGWGDGAGERRQRGQAGCEGEGADRGGEQERVGFAVPIFAAASGGAGGGGGGYGVDRKFSSQRVFGKQAGAELDLEQDDGDGDLEMSPPPQQQLLPLDPGLVEDGAAAVAAVAATAGDLKHLEPA